MARLLALALLLAPLPLVAQDAPPSTSPPAAKAKPPIPNGRITGHVLCSDTHSPARGASIMVAVLPSADGKRNEGKAGQMSRVAMDGTFTVEHVAPGEYAVLAFYAGYLSPLDELTAEDMATNPSPAKERELLSRFGTVTVHGSETETFDLSLVRGASLSGHVLYSDGSPASQIPIEVQDAKSKPPKPDSNGISINPAAFARSALTHQPQFTDDQGRFRISGLKPGSYRVAAIQKDASRASSQSEFDSVMGAAMSDPTDLHIYAGDTLHKNSAKVYDLSTADELTGVDITIPLDIFHVVHGTLTAKDGRPINSATITLTDTADDAFSFQSRPGRDGSFTFSAVPSGTYSITASGAKIVSIPEGMPDDVPVVAFGAQPLNAFADSSSSVIVKDSDLTDVSVTVAEVPLPPQPHQPNNPQPIPDDQPEPQP